MDLNPSALLPSANIPHIPNTERIEILKMYGDADVTVSTARLTFDPLTDGKTFVGIF